MILIKTLIYIAISYIETNKIYVVSQIVQRSSFMLSQNGRLNFPELAAKYGHPAKTDYVITEDGYNLTLDHIPGDKTRAVLLVHGNTPTSDCWIIRGKTSLAITLASQGYDVWAINLRGSTYSRRHISLDPDLEPEGFFNFSFYEQGVYDLPATIDFVLKETGQRQLLAIGHSVGCTLFYVMGSERPEYNDKVKLAVSLAPIAFVQTVQGLAAISVVHKPLLAFLRSLNVHEILSQEQFGPVMRATCFKPIGYELCVKGILFSMLGYDLDGLEPGFMFNFLGHWPGGSSVKTFEHIAQVFSSNRFAMYDYGERENRRVYNSPMAPLFNLSKVTMKSALFVGREDFLAGVGDSVRLNRSLPNVVHYQLMPYKKFNHVDFIWGRNMPLNFYPYLFSVIEKYI